MKAIATEMGLWAGSRVRPGSEIDYPDDIPLPSWLRPAAGAVPAAPAKQPPRTMSEMNRRPKMDNKVVRTLSELGKQDDQ